MGLYHLDDQQLADYQEGRRARLAREADGTLREILSLVLQLRALLQEETLASAPGKVADVCAALAVQGAAFKQARDEAGHDGVLLEGP